MTEFTGVIWFSRQPRWLQTLVYDLTGWHVTYMTLTCYTGTVDRLEGITEHKIRKWSRAKKIQEAS